MKMDLSMSKMSVESSMYSIAQQLKNQRRFLRFRRKPTATTASNKNNLKFL